ncbi:MAG: Holliday junction resolvase RecU [Firmicutes bacterium]|nr:Holliday junction resolvase RecU [Bacillota bacterium]
MDPVRQYQGAVNRAQGKQFEQYIEISLAYYRQQGLAMIEKTPEPMMPCKSLKNGKCVAYFQKKAQPDYQGTLAGGRSVVFEAKYTAGGKLEQGRVSDEQAKCLALHQKLGALCFILAGFGLQNVYAVPWEVWQDMKAGFGRKYVTGADLELYRVQHGRNGILLLFSNIEGRRIE